MNVGRARVVLALLIVLVAETTHAYEFEVEATSTGQGYQTRWLRFRQSDELLNRRRFTQSLRLYIWDILDPPADPGYPDREERAPFGLYFVSSMRMDNDFGGFTQDRIIYSVGPTAVVRDPARIVVPEIAGGNLQLDLLYAYFGARDLFGFLDVRLGRQLKVDTLDWVSFDGLSLRLATPWSVDVVAHGGLEVRGDLVSALGTSTFESDGTSTAQCAEFDPGLGFWTVGDDCAQRRQLMPTVGGGLEADWQFLQAQLGYRRTMSSTATDVYERPSDVPRWGVNAEHATASLRANLAGGMLSPWATARYNLLLSQVDQVSAGVRFVVGEHTLTPEYLFLAPAFDGDSIFNIFSTEPYQDFRLTYDVWPQRGSFRGYVRGSLRRFHNSDENQLLAGEMIATAAISQTLGLGAQLRGSDRDVVRMDLFYEGGYGGLRAGGDLSGRVRTSHRLEFEGRLTLIGFDTGNRPDEMVLSFGAQAGAMWTFGEGVVGHLLVEENVSERFGSQLRVIMMFDLMFRPEV